MSTDYRDELPATIAAIDAVEKKFRANFDGQLDYTDEEWRDEARTYARAALDAYILAQAHKHNPSLEGAIVEIIENEALAAFYGNREGSWLSVGAAMREKYRNAASDLVENAARQAIYAYIKNMEYPK